MAKVLTTDRLVNTALRRAMIPENQSTFTSDDVQDILNEEFGIHVVPNVLKAHEEFYVVSEDVALVSNKTSYKIPYRAIGNKIREISYVDSNGAVYEMTRVTIEDVPQYKGHYSTNRVYAFYLKGDSVVLINETAQSGSLRFSYYLRPSELVENDRGGVITDIDTATVPGETTITMSTFPEHFSTITLFDIVQGKSPNNIITFDRTILSVDANAQTVTFTTIEDIDSSLVAGDIITQAEESIVPQLPTELHPILAQRAAVKMLEALGDTEGMNNAQRELERMEYNSMTLIDNRAEGSTLKVKNTHSTLSQSVRSRRRRRGY